MADTFGESYMPGAQGNPNNTANGPAATGAAPSPIQSAIRFMSLRMPRFAGPNSIAAPGLLNAPGAMGTPGAGLNGAAMNPLLMALLHLAGLSGGPTSPGSVAGIGTATPSGMGSLAAAGMADTTAGGPTSSPMPRITPASGDWKQPPNGQPAWIEQPPGSGNWVRPPGWTPNPMQPQPGPGVPTFPETGGGPTLDRSNPSFGGRGDRFPLNGFDGSRGPFTRA